MLCELGIIGLQPFRMLPLENGPNRLVKRNALSERQEPIGDFLADGMTKRIARGRSFVLESEKVLLHQLIEHRLDICQSRLSRINPLRGLRSKVSADRAGDFQQKLHFDRKRVDATDYCPLKICRQ